jgi:hypothetical protein
MKQLTTMPKSRMFLEPEPDEEMVIFVQAAAFLLKYIKRT